MPTRQELAARAAGSSSGGGWGWNIGDAIGSPFFNVLETASSLPGIDQTGFSEWLQTSPVTSGVRTFQENHPGWETGLDIAGALIPFVGWGAKTIQAGNALRAGATAPGLFGLTDDAALQAARLFPRSPAVAVATAETVRYAPLGAAISAFDLAGGRHESATDALLGFGFNTVFGAGVQAAGMALSPIITRKAPEFIGTAWRTVFEPGPELMALYGFSDNIRRAAADAAALPKVQEVADPSLDPQHRMRMSVQLINDMEQARLEIAAGRPVDDPRLAEADPDLIRTLFDEDSRLVLTTHPTRAERVDFNGVPAELRPTFDHLLRMEANTTGNRVRVPITSDKNSNDNRDVLSGKLELPENWLSYVQFPGITQATFKSADALRLEVGLEGGPGVFRRVRHITPNGREQVWTVADRGNGMYTMVTELPVDMGDPPRMTGRARYSSTKNMDKAELAREFFSFNTDRPDVFIPQFRIDPDVAGGVLPSLEDRIPRGVSEFLDKLLDFRNVILSPNTIRAAHKAKYGTPQEREAFVKELLAGPGAGTTVRNWLETFAAPTRAQLGNSPEGRGILGFWQAAFEGGEARARSVLHGTVSIPDDKNPLTSLFAEQGVDDTNALVPELRRVVLEDKNNLDLLRRYDSGEIKLESLQGTRIGDWLQRALEVNKNQVEEINGIINLLRTLGVTDARLIPIRKDHIGISRTWDGSIFHPIYADNQVQPIAVVAGNSRSQGERKAQKWIERETARLAAKGEKKALRAGQAFILNETDEVPNWMRRNIAVPGLIEPRLGMRGYEYEFEPYDHVDKLIGRLESNYVRRWRYAAAVIADALTAGKINMLKTRDPHSFNIVKTRTNQLQAIEGPLEKRINQITDKVLAPVFGTKSATKLADGSNELMFHLLHGAGNIATPTLNLTSYLQTQLPQAVRLLTSNVNSLKQAGYELPIFGHDGLPRPGFNFVTDGLALMWGGIKEATGNDPRTREVYNALFKRKVMGGTLANESTGEDRTWATRASEGIRGPDDVLFWMKRVSSILMSKSEEVSRVWGAGMSIRAMKMIEEATGQQFTMDQLINNAARFVDDTNYAYFTADRPMMYTGPLGSIFGNQKTWMTNYLFMMMEYFGLARQGNIAPLMFSLGTTTALGGIFAVPLLGAGVDVISETFADQDAKEFIFERMGEGGNAISFGLPALFGMSLNGNVAAPGSNLAHDAEFFFTIVAWERAKLVGRAVGTAWDDQMTLGMDPMENRIFQQQALQAFAPRALYRSWEALTSDHLTSAATGYPMIRELGWGSRIMHSMGFRDTDIAVQYAAYESLLKDRDRMREKVSLFGEAYARASIEHNYQEMNRLLQVAAVQGIDQSSIMRSAQIRMRNYGYDMFGRNFNQQQLDRYQRTLETAGREE